MKSNLVTTFLVAVGIGIQLAVAGCTSTTGSQFCIGVVPINAVSDVRTLTKTKESK